MTDNPRPCAICAREFSEHGYDPAPLGSAPNVCCPDCSDRFAVPVRMILGRNFSNKKQLGFLRELAKRGRFMVESRALIKAHKPVRRAA